MLWGSQKRKKKKKKKKALQKFPEKGRIIKKVKRKKLKWSQNPFSLSSSLVDSEN